MSVGLFTTITGLGRKNWRGGFRECYFSKGVWKPNTNPGKNLICKSSNVSIPSVSLYDLGISKAWISTVTTTNLTIGTTFGGQGNLKVVKGTGW